MKELSRVCPCQVSRLFSIISQLLMYQPTKYTQAIHMIAMKKPSDEKVVVIGPATLNERNGCQDGVSHDTSNHCYILTDSHFIRQDWYIANTDLPITCTFVAVDCPEQSICLFCRPNRDQLEHHNYRTHRSYSTYSCRPNTDKTTATVSCVSLAKQRPSSKS